jgi:hypothetical protein
MLRNPINHRIDLKPLGQTTVPMMLLAVLMLLTGSCSATTPQIIPTARPTISPTPSPTPTATLDANATATVSPSPAPVTATGGPSPTPLLGPTRIPVIEAATATPVLNPNAPRIEFFTADTLAVAPGTPVTLFWSTRGATGAVIYQLSRGGERERLWNVDADGNLPVATQLRDRGQLDFLLVVGEGELEVQQTLSIPLACPVTWFFSPSPEECPDAEVTETFIIEQDFERGRLIYVEDRNRIYALFNDGRAPGWLVFQNRYDPSIHPELEESFVPPTGYYQPIARLGYVWRGNDTVRNRLGLGINVEAAFDGFIQTTTLGDGSEALYISSTGGVVLQLIASDNSWSIISLR